MTWYRCAVYYAPDPGSELGRLGAQWLGRDAAGEAVRRPPFADARFETLTSAPRHYGFHATLKAPMRLAEGESVDAVVHHAQAWARRQAPFEVRLSCALLGGFLALRPADVRSSAALARLAQRCLRDFEPFRRPLDDEELRRRQKKHVLSEAQTALLARWGYPYVLDEFRFHMTLSSRLEVAAERDLLLDHARVWFADALSSDLRVDAIAIFAQRHPDSAFELLERVRFDGMLKGD